jgi:hypothetical protein
VTHRHPAQVRASSDPRVGSWDNAAAWDRAYTSAWLYHEAHRHPEAADALPCSDLHELAASQIRRAIAAEYRELEIRAALVGIDGLLRGEAKIRRRSHLGEP